MMTIKQFTYREPFSPPAESIATIKAGNGYFTHVATPLYQALVRQAPLRKPNRLANAQESLTLHFPKKIDATIIQEATAFFRTVKERHFAEAYLTIFYDPANEQFLLAAPPQQNRAGSVSTKPLPAPDGYLELGSFHSHPGAAYHSITDIADETKNDGIHLIAGHLERPNPDIVGTISVRGHRFTINPADIIEYPWEYDGPWLQQIKT